MEMDRLQQRRALQHGKVQIAGSTDRHLPARRLYNCCLRVLRGGGVVLNRTTTPAEQRLLSSRTATTLFQIEVEHGDIVRLLGTASTAAARYLNDNTIDAWMRLLMRRTYEQGGKDYFFSTQFYRRLLDGENLLRWTSPTVVSGILKPARMFRVPKNCSGLTTIWQANRLFIPVILGGNHWVLVVVTVGGNGARGIECYDSGARYGHDLQVPMKLIRTWLQKEWAKTSTVLEVPDPVLHTWPTVRRPAPQQPNDYDCGVFVCMIADFLSNNESLEVPMQGPWLRSMRQRMAVRIRQGEDSLHREIDVIDLT
jgi:Ulp1 family protease